MSVLNIGHRHCGIGNPVVDNSIDRNCHWVLGQHLVQGNADDLEEDDQDDDNHIDDQVNTDHLDDDVDDDNDDEVLNDDDEVNNDGDDDTNLLWRNA